MVLASPALSSFGSSAAFVFAAISGELWVAGLGLRVSGLGFRALGLGFRVEG